MHDNKPQRVFITSCTIDKDMYEIIKTNQSAYSWEIHIDVCLRNSYWLVGIRE